MNSALEKDIYFNEDDFILYQGDSFEILKEIEPKSIDMIFADPPYFLSSNGISCQNGKQVSVNKGDWDVSKDINDRLSYHREWIKLSRQVLKDNGTIFISATLHSVYAIGVALELEGFSIINNIIWRKTNPAPNLACRCFTHSTETIIWARKQINVNKKGNHTFNYQAMKLENGGKQMKDVWEFDDDGILYTSSTTPKNEKTEGHHPTQKPIKLLKRIIEASTKENDLVLDPFSGSGTTGIACHMLGRRYIGIEQDLDYLEISKKRYLKESVKDEKKL